MKVKYEDESEVLKSKICEMKDENISLKSDKAELEAEIEVNKVNMMQTESECKELLAEVTNLKEKKLKIEK